MLKVTIRNQGWLEGAEAEWTDLIDRSDANSLFLGWRWQNCWWRHIGASLDCQARIIVVMESETILGVAPYFERTNKAFRLVPVRRMQMSGNIWNIATGVVSEYVDWILDIQEKGRVADAISNALWQLQGWQEIAVSFEERKSFHLNKIEALGNSHRMYIRNVSSIERFAIDTSRNVDEFKVGLSHSSRSKMFRKRIRLEKRGKVSLHYADQVSTPIYLDHLFELHERRWSVSLSTSAKEFYRNIADAYSLRDELRLSVLAVSGKPISVVLSILDGGIEYNILSAFDASFDKSISPGLLHLGYELERSFASDTSKYDLLAGSGRIAQFKQAFAGEVGEFHSMQFVRDSGLKRLYRLYDAIR